MASLSITTAAVFFLIAALQHLSPAVGFLFPDLKFRPDVRSAGVNTPKYRIAVIQEEPYLYANGSGYVPDLMRRIAQSYRNQHNGDEFIYELTPVTSWNSLISRARSSRGQLALGMIIPSLELTGWSGHQLQSSIPTVYTTLKLVASKRKAAEWSSVVDGSAAASQLEDVDVVAATGARGRMQLTDRVKIVVLRGSPAEYLLVRSNGYRGPIYHAETAEEAVSALINNADEAVLLTDALVADHIANKYSSELESICPSRLSGSGWIYFAFFGRDEAMINKLNEAIAPLVSDASLLGLYTKHFGGQYSRQAGSQSLQQCPW